MDSLLWTLIVGAAVAGFVQGLSGFAFSLVSISFWAWTVEPRLAAVLAVFGGFCGQVVAAVTVRRGVDWRLLWPFVFGGLAGLPLGMLLLPQLDVQVFKGLLGTLLVLWCPAMLFAGSLPRLTRGGRFSDGLIGAIGGALGPLGGFTGAVPTLWCTLRGFDKDTQRAVIQNFNLAMLGVTMATYFATGVVTREMWPMFAVVGPAMLIPSLLGARLYIGMSEASFRRLVLGLLTASGVAMLVSAVPPLLSRSIP